MIYIFGDSYGMNREVDAGWVWPELLNKTERVNNFSQGGTGPIESFDFFWRVLNDIKEEDKVVFLLSNPYRIPFVFRSRPHSSQPRLSYSKTIEKLNDTEIDYLTDFTLHPDHAVEWCNLVMRKELETMNYKNISLLNCLSRSLNIKTMVFVCFSIHDKETESRLDDSFLLHFSKLNDEYFRLYEHTLSQFSPWAEEQEDYTKEVREGLPQKLAMHLLEEEHMIVYNIIMNHFYGGNRSEKFREGSKIHRQKKGYQDSRNFIYE